MDWLRRILAMLFGGRSDDRDDAWRPAGVSRESGARDDSRVMNESGSPDERDEADDDRDVDGDDRDTDASSDGGGDDGGGDDGGGDDD